MPQVSSSAWDVPEGPQGSTPLGDWDPSAGLSRRPSLSPGDGTLRGGLLWAPGERRQVQASWSPRGGAPCSHLGHPHHPLCLPEPQSHPHGGLCFPTNPPPRSCFLSRPEHHGARAPAGSPSQGSSLPPRPRAALSSLSCPQPAGQSRAPSSVFVSLAGLRAQHRALSAQLPVPEQTEVGLLPPSLDFGSQRLQSLLCFSVFCSAS